MILHQSPYGQIIKFTSEYYYSLSDAALSEIEQNCANIDRSVVTIGTDKKSLDLDDEFDIDIENL